MSEVKHEMRIAVADTTGDTMSRYTPYCSCGWMGGSSYWNYPSEIMATWADHLADPESREPHYRPEDFQCLR